MNATTIVQTGSSRAWRAAAAAIVGAATLTGTTGIAAAASTAVSTAPVVAFQAAGDVGGGVNIQTSGLPAGAYTVWWVIFDTPDGCTDRCGEDDLFNPDAHVSVFFATGGVIRDNGVGNFRARYQTGDDLGEPGSQHILGDGAVDPSRAEVHNIIKYHGPASTDPSTLYEQTHTLLGACSEGANAVDLGEPFGVQCFDPQAVAHPLP
jgi:hypothetical protein